MGGYLEADNSINVKWLPLGEILKNLRTGLNPRQNFVLNTSDANNYYVTVRELNGKNIIIDSKTDKVNDVALSIINNRSKLKVGDILFSGTGTIGRTAYIDNEPKNWNIKEGVYALTIDDKIVKPMYLIYFLNSEWGMNQIKSKVVGSPVGSIPMGELKKIVIPIPPIDEQKRIETILNKFDTLTSSIRDGLPKEIELRKRQYKYYRDMLLTF